jgi:hypothetical protein
MPRIRAELPPADRAASDELHLDGALDRNASTAQFHRPDAPLMHGTNRHPKPTRQLGRTTNRTARNFDRIPFHAGKLQQCWLAGNCIADMGRRTRLSSNA